MKFEYLKKTDEHGTRYCMIPSDIDGSGRAEVKFLTILRDMGLKEGVTFKVIGAEHLNKNIAGLPDQPVKKLAIELIEPEGGEALQAHDARDPHARTPNKPPKKPFGATSGRGNPMRIIGQGETTIVQEVDPR